MLIVLCVIFVLTVLEFTKTVYLKAKLNNLLEKTGVLLKQKFVFKPLNGGVNVFSGKCFFKTTKPISYNIKNSFYTNNFFLGFNTLLKINNKTIKLPNNFFFTGCYKNITINKKATFLNNKTIIKTITLKNNSKKEIDLKICLKNYYNVQQPKIFITQKNKTTTMSYNDNFISIVAFNECKKLKQNVMLPFLQNCSLHNISVKLAPKQKKVIKILILLSLQISTMQSTKFSYVSSKSNKQTSMQEQLFNYTYETKCKKINNLINCFLPKIFSKSNFSISELYNYIFNTEIKTLQNYSYKTIIKWLLKRKEFARLYHYILICVLGIKPMSHILSFEKQHHYLGTILISYKNITIKKFNLKDSFYFLSNNIIYKNVKIVNLQKHPQNVNMFLTK